MSLDERLLQRVRDLLAGDAAVEEKRMVGGRSFLRHGRLGCGVASGGLVVRVGAADRAAALAEPHVTAMTMGGRPVTAYVVVAPEGVPDDEALGRWVRRGFAATERARGG